MGTKKEPPDKYIIPFPEIVSEDDVELQKELEKIFLAEKEQSEADK